MTCEKKLQAVLLENYHRAGKETGYWGRYFYRELLNKGGVLTVKGLLRPSRGSRIAPGFQALIDAGRTDLSVEAVALEPRFRELFTDEERAEAQRQWDVQPEETPTDTVLACEQAAFLRDQYDRVENLREAVAFLASATFRGFAHVEKHYAEGGRGIVRLEPVEQWFWCRSGMFGEWSYNRDARSGVDVGEKIERANFAVVESPIALDRILAVQYFRRNLALRDWSSFLDVYGIPSMFFIGPPGVTEEKEKQYLAIAQDLVKDGRGYLPNGTDVKYVNGGGSGKPPFRDHLDYLDRQITLLGTGGLLTMLTESGSGTLAGNAHQEAFNQVAKADAVMVSEALQRDFDAPMLAAVFPGWPVEAGFELRMPDMDAGDI